MSATLSFSVRETKTISAVAGWTTLPVAKPEGGKGKSGLCLQVPSLSENALQSILNSEAGRQWLSDCVDGLRSKMASEIYKSSKRPILEQEIGLTAILEQMKKEVESVRLSARSIGEWFDAEVSEYVKGRILTKAPGISAEKLAAVLAAYRGMFCTLNKRPEEVIMSAEQKAQLVSVFDLLPEDYSSVIGDQIAARLAQVGDVVDLI